MLPDDYLTACDETVSIAHNHRADSTEATTYVFEAQVKAIQAVAAAIDRLATAVEALSPPSPPYALRGCSDTLLREFKARASFMFTRCWW